MNSNESHIIEIILVNREKNEKKVFVVEEKSRVLLCKFGVSGPEMAAFWDDRCGNIGGVAKQHKSGIAGNENSKPNGPGNLCCRNWDNRFANTDALHRSWNGQHALHGSDRTDQCGTLCASLIVDPDQIPGPERTEGADEPLPVSDFFGRNSVLERFQQHL